MFACLLPDSLFSRCFSFHRLKIFSRMYANLNFSKMVVMQLWCNLSLHSFPLTGLTVLLLFFSIEIRAFKNSKLKIWFHKKIQPFLLSTDASLLELNWWRIFAYSMRICHVLTVYHVNPILIRFYLVAIHVSDEQATIFPPHSIVLISVLHVMSITHPFI